MAQVDPPDFGALMAAANAGDAEAYVQLLRMLTPLIRQVVRRQRWLTGAEDVEDVVQEVLLSVHSVRGTYDAERPFLPWLLAIVRRRVIDTGRRRMRQATREVALDESAVTLTPRATAAFAGLAVAGLSSVTACLSRPTPHGTTVTVFVWHLGTLLVLVAAAAWTGRHLLVWRVPPRVASAVGESSWH